MMNKKIKGLRWDTKDLEKIVKNENPAIEWIDPHYSKVKIAVKGCGKLLILSYGELEKALNNGWLKDIHKGEKDDIKEEVKTGK